MYRLAANMEWLFTEVGDDIGDRIRAAAAHGFDAVEMWGWRDKNLDSIEAALKETGVLLLSLIVDPKLDLTDRNNHDEYLRGVDESLIVAQRLGSPNLVVVAGDEIAGVTRKEQHDAVSEGLRRAADRLVDSDVTLLLEPLNTRVDHPGSFLSSTKEGLAIIREVDSPHLRLLLDAYHALMMDEDLATEIAGSIDLIGHVQVADVPGRHEPGTGNVDWGRQFHILHDLGYRGAYGLEYLPTVSTAASLEVIEGIAIGRDLTTGGASK